MWRFGKRRNLRAGKTRPVKIAGRSRSNRWRVNVSEGGDEVSDMGAIKQMSIGQREDWDLPIRRKVFLPHVTPHWATGSS